MGEIIGIADSGLDVTSCFFSDPDEEPPWDTRSARHRKLVSYRGLYDRQDASGHGTLVAGSAAGQCTDKKYKSNAAYNGMAVDAKLAFMDIGTGSGVTGDPDVLRPPSDIDTNLLSVLYDDVSKSVCALCPVLEGVCDWM